MRISRVVMNREQGPEIDGLEGSKFILNSDGTSRAHSISKSTKIGGFPVVDPAEVHC